MTRSGKLLVSSAALVVALLVGLTPFVADAQRGGGSPPPPTTETASVLCAQTGNKILRYSPDGTCPPHHQAVAFVDGPVTACASTLTGVMRLTGPGMADCQAHETSVTLPGEDLSFACASPYTNVLTYVATSSSCQPSYTVVQFIPGPAAADDTYTGDDATPGNTQLSVDAADGVLANDASADPSMTVAGYDAASANAGDVVVNPDGSFTYNPPVGFNGTDTFSYTVEDAAGQQATAEVTVQVDGMVWYIDNSLATNGDGRLTSPFNTLATINDNEIDPDDEGEFIFLFEGSGPYAGITLEDGQHLVGQGLDFTLFTDVIVPAANPPTIQGNPAIELAENTEISGLTAASSSGSDTVSGRYLTTPPYIHDVTIHPPADGGIALSLFNAEGGILVENSTIAGTGDGTGIRMLSIGNEGGGAYFEINAVTFEGLETGVDVATDSDDHYFSVAVIDSQFTNVAGRGIWAQGYGIGSNLNLDVHGSTFDNTGIASNDHPAIRVTTDEESELDLDIEITGNTITGVPVSGPEGRGAIDIAILGDSFAYTLISNNTITGGSSTGIDVRSRATTAGEPELFVGIFENTIDVPGTGIALRSLNENEDDGVYFNAHIAGNTEISGGAYGIWARAEGDGAGTGFMYLTIENNTINGQVRVRSRNYQDLETGLFGNTIVSTTDAINFRSWGVSSFCSTLLGNSLTSGDESADISLREWDDSEMRIYELTNLGVANNSASVDANASVGTSEEQCGEFRP